jgi:hypothetical protein
MSTTLHPPAGYTDHDYPTPKMAPAVEAAVPTPAGIAGVAWYVWAILAAATCVVVGIIWDISWHMTIGRDGLLSPPHVSSYLGGAITGLTCGWLALKTTFRGTPEEHARSVRVWGFRAPFGAWVCVWGAFAMLTSAPFDDWWHQAYGLDVQIISPPHTVLAFGMQGIVIGAMLMTAAWQNQVAGAGNAGSARGLPTWLNLVGMGYVLTMIAVFTTEYSERGAMHGPLFYVIAAVAYPAVLVASVRATSAGGVALRWPATTVALTYMAVRALMLWILPLFPGQPRLGPVYQPVTHFVPMDFPLLLVAPALAIDVVMRRLRAHVVPAPGEARLRDWGVAVVLSLAFTAAFVAAQWPFADFLQSPLARNRVFATHMFPYMVPGNVAYTTWQYYPGQHGLPAAEWVKGIAIALLLGTLASRVGLAWGRWMARVQR